MADEGSNRTVEKKRDRQWVRPGQRLQIQMQVEVVSVAGKKVNLKVLGNPSAECVESKPSSNLDG